jgi:predicted P-loop ATPase
VEERVRMLGVLERERQRKLELRTVGNIVNVPTEAPESSESNELVDNFFGLLEKTKTGEVKCTGFNISLILEFDSRYRKLVRWNNVDKRIDGFGRLVGYDREVLHVVLSNELSKHYHINIGFNEMYMQMMAVAFENRYDPIQDYLRSLKWDGVPRIDDGNGWLSTYMRAEVTSDEFTREAGRKWLVSAVARAMEPGCKADLVLIVLGDQGQRKSSGFKELGGEWYCDVSIVLGDKDSKMIAGGKWIMELPDLASLKKSGEVNAIKAFFSTQNDYMRLPFGRTHGTYPRRGVFAGTTNDSEFLGDQTGNRRYLIIKCGKVNLAAIRRDRDQIWAEAVVLYERHVKECADKLECGCWWFSTEDKRVEKHTEEHVQEAPAEVLIGEWWYGMSPEKRPRVITTVQAAVEGMMVPKERVGRGLLMDVGTSLRKLGFTKTRQEQGGRFLRVYVATDEMMGRPQTDKGKDADKRFGTVKVPVVAGMVPTTN